MQRVFKQFGQSAGAGAQRRPISLTSTIQRIPEGARVQFGGRTAAL